MAPCVRALLLAICLVHGHAVPAQHTRVHVGMSKLSVVAAFVSMVAGDETAAAKEVDEGDKAMDNTEDEAKTEKEEEDEESLLEEAGGLDEEGNEEEEDEEEDEEDEEEVDPRHLMEDMDTNKDGTLSLTELMTDDVPKEREGALTEAFNRFDHNKDNKIDSDELPALVEEMRKRFKDKEDMEDGGEEEAPEKPEDVMRGLDTDKDSALSFTELVGKEDEPNLMEQDRRNFMEVFQAFDKNKDGKLDMQELPAAMEELDKRDL